MLTDDVIKVLMMGFNDPCNLAEQQWRDLDALLPHGSKGPDDPKLLRREFGDSADFMQKKWRDLDARLLAGPKGRDRVFRMIAAAANDYLKAVANPMPAKLRQRQLATEIKALQRALTKLGPESVDDRTKLKAMIDGRQKQWHDLQYHADFYEGAAFRRRMLVLNLFLIWLSCGGEIKSSRKKDSGEPSGPLIKFLKFSCGAIMGKHAPAAETLRADIKDFKTKLPKNPKEPMDSKMWTPARRRPRK